MGTQYPDLNEASVFLTGGGSGIGAALLDGFLAQGAKVGFIDLGDSDQLVDEMEQIHGQRPLAIKGDVTDTPVLQAAIARAAEANGALSVLVTCAAFDQRFDALNITEAEWDEMQAVNLRHYFFACQAAAKAMKNGGSIINYSSTSHHIGMTQMAAYTSANAGIGGLTRTLAREWGPLGIRVNAVAPGWVLTERQKELWVTDKGLRAHIDRQCLPTEIQPQDMVGPTLFLASGASRVITGQCIAVDAGYTGLG